MKAKFKIGVGGFRLGDPEKRYVDDCLDKNRLSPGKYTRRFEKRFARLHNRKYAVFCNSGTSALQVAIHALKDKYKWPDGAEVVVPALTFVATINTVMQNRLKPVFADIEPDYFTLDPRKLARAVTKKTVAVVPVHILGQSAEMDEIMDIAQKHNLAVIEDSCETMFADYHGKKAGSFGEISCFSTNSAHFIATGSGGLVSTDDNKIYHTVRSLINHGRDDDYTGMDDDDTKDKKKLSAIVEKRFRFIRLGYSYRTSEIDAALALGQLSRWKSIVRKRQQNAKYLTQGLQNLAKFMQLPKIRPDCSHVFMVYPIVVKDKRISVKNLIYHLETHDIETRFLLPTLSQPVYREMFGSIGDQYPVADRISKNGFYIGCHQELTNSELDYIVDRFQRYFKNKI